MCPLAVDVALLRGDNSFPTASDIPTFRSRHCLVESAWHATELSPTCCRVWPYVPMPPMSNAEKTLVIVATYNERESLPRLVEEVFRYAPDVDLLVIDDNSPDGTGNWCDEKAADDPRLRCLHRPGKQGLGSATVAGMKYGIEHGYKHVLNMDADFSHDPRFLPDILAGMESKNGRPVDVMIGSRYVPGGRIEGWPRLRYVMSWAINTYSRLLLGLKARDCSGAYRCYRTARLAEVDFDRILSHGYAFQEEILWHLKRMGCRMAETPITFVNRTAGASKINLREAWSAAWVILVLGWKNIMERKKGSDVTPVEGIVGNDEGRMTNV